MKKHTFFAASAAAVLLAGVAPAFADTTTGSAMMIADISREVDALANGPHTDARIVRAANAAYPDFERLAGQGATIRVEVDLDAAGHLKAATVHPGSGHPRFDANALAAVRSSTFAPATINGQSVAGTYDVDVTFDPAR